MFSRRAVASALFVLAFASPRALAAPQPDGTDPSLAAVSAPAPGAVTAGCSVLWYGNDSQSSEINRLISLGYTVTQATVPAQLSAASLASRDILVIAYTGSGTITTAQPAIAGFVESGGALLIHQPNHIGTLDYAPQGFDVNNLHIRWCGLETSTPYYNPVIVEPNHPITTGLVDSDLSGDFESVANWGSGYTVLSRNGDCEYSAMALGAGTLGSGRVVYDSGNMGTSSNLRPGTNAYWSRVFGWLCGDLPVPARHSTWGGVKSRYR
jgi:hypothetical protein